MKTREEIEKQLKEDRHRRNIEKANKDSVKEQKRNNQLERAISYRRNKEMQKKDRIARLIALAALLVSVISLLQQCGK